mmetsp:Transcript_83238/g.239279  ORF Transcript_83238/g.239279 Transcript_83238/m.239279 type:complete len:226 (+) Transcript_83238:276-953(+)
MQLAVASSVRKSVSFLAAVLAISALRRWLRGKLAEAGLGSVPADPTTAAGRGGAGRGIGGSNSDSRGKGGGRGGGGRGAGGGRGGGRGRSSQARASSPNSEPFRGPASEAELGAAWHFGGLRRWEWLHNGEEANGWLELGAGGTLQTSFSNRGSTNWERKSTGELVITFGNCHHFCELLTPRMDSAGRAPMFLVRDRQMKDGSGSRPQKRPTRGRLVLGDAAVGR